MSSLFPERSNVEPPADAPLTRSRQFQQRKYWRKNGGEFMLVREMGAQHVNNTIKMLDEYAKEYVASIFGDSFNTFLSAPDEVFDAWEHEYREALDNPKRWIRATPLYRALKRQRRTLALEEEAAAQ